MCRRPSGVCRLQLDRWAHQSQQAAHQGQLRCAGHAVLTSAHFCYSHWLTPTWTCNVCAVSEKHARVSWNGRSWVIRDTNSSNGTAVNGQQLQALGELRACRVEWPCQHERQPRTAQ